MYSHQLGKERNESNSLDIWKNGRIAKLSYHLNAIFDSVRFIDSVKLSKQLKNCIMNEL